MSVTGLVGMHQLIDAAIERFERWKQTPEAAAVPPLRWENLREKLQALRNCGSVGLVRTGLEHIAQAMVLAGIPAHVFEADFRQLIAAMEQRGAAGQAIKTCDECGSLYFAESSSMAALCPECSHFLYGYEACQHTFVAGRCSRCHWDGSVSPLKK